MTSYSPPLPHAAAARPVGAHGNGLPGHVEREAGAAGLLLRGRDCEDLVVSINNASVFFTEGGGLLFSVVAFAGIFYMKQTCSIKNSIGEFGLGLRDRVCVPHPSFCFLMNLIESAPLFCGLLGSSFLAHVLLLLLFLDRASPLPFAVRIPLSITHIIRSSSS